LFALVLAAVVIKNALWGFIGKKRAYEHGDYVAAKNQKDNQPGTPKIWMPARHSKDGMQNAETAGPVTLRSSSEHDPKQVVERKRQWHEHNCH
jgi:hypothetical protein